MSCSTFSEIMTVGGVRGGGGGTLTAPLIPHCCGTFAEAIHGN